MLFCSGSHLCFHLQHACKIYTGESLLFVQSSDRESSLAPEAQGLEFPFKCWCQACFTSAPRAGFCLQKAGVEPFFFFFSNVLKGICPFSPFQLEKALLADWGLECRARAIPKLRGWQVFLSLMRGRRIAQMKQGIKLCKFSCCGSSIV